MVGDPIDLGLKRLRSSEDQPPGDDASKSRPPVRREKVAHARKLLQQSDYPNAEVVAGVASRMAEILRRRGRGLSF